MLEFIFLNCEIQLLISLAETVAHEKVFVDRVYKHGLFFWYDINTNSATALGGFFLIKFTPVLVWSHSHKARKRIIERRLRVEPHGMGDGKDRSLRLIDKEPDRLLDTVLIDERIKVAVQPLVQELRQLVRGYGKLIRAVQKGNILVRIYFFYFNQLHDAAVELIGLYAREA